MPEHNLHEYLKKEDYYETRSVAKSRKPKSCAHCRYMLLTGTPQDVHTFYPEFAAYPTHKSCTSDFLESLRP